jgi:hypothetical protein
MTIPSKTHRRQDENMPKDKFKMKMAYSTGKELSPDWKYLVLAGPVKVLKRASLLISIVRKILTAVI